MTKYYLDACIWRDYYENRSDNLRPIGEWAFEFLKKVLSEDAQILITDQILKELSKDYGPQRIRDTLCGFKQCLVMVSISKMQAKKARMLSKERRIPKGDMLHAIVAQDNNAILISRDKHFDELRDIAESYKPEELL